MFEDWRENAVAAIAKTCGPEVINSSNFGGSISAPNAHIAGSNLLAMINHMVHRTAVDPSWTPRSNRHACRLPKHIVAFIHSESFNYFNM
jgi:hypothetical protein